jgi:putative ABC transport system substrate-binding protein
MRYKAVAFLFVLFALASVQVSEAQRAGKVSRIVYVSTAGDPKNPTSEREAFQEGLRDLGYIAGKNVIVEWRYLEGNLDRLPNMMAELIESKVDVICVGSLTGIRAAKKATTTIPIVMLTTADPVDAGLVKSLARPGGNLTGLTLLTRELTGKQLELLKEVVPTTSRAGFLLDADSSPARVRFKEYESAASGQKMALEAIEVQRTKPDFQGVFQTVSKRRMNALIVVRSSLFLGHRKHIADLAIKHRIASMNEINDYVEAGGLMSYSANYADSYRRAGVYAAKILNGASPGELPIEQPTKFEFVINLKTAKQIGLTIPPSVLARADRVIK